MFFSVIVPAYNAQDYLKECVESILAQSFSDFELILVDDGSTDQTPQMCDAYAKQDARVRVIHQPNGGQTKARTNGLRTALGEYVLYVDADDWIDQNTMRDAWEVIGQYHPDLISCGISEVAADWSREQFDPVPAGFYDRAGIERTIHPCILMDDRMKNITCSITTKVVRRELLVRKQLEVDQTLTMGEDTACTVGLYSDAQSVYITNKVYFFIRSHPASFSRRFRMELFDLTEKTVRYLERIKVPTDDFPQQIDRYVFHCVFCMLLLAVQAGGEADEIAARVGEEGYRKHLARAEFRKLTPKTWVVFHLLKHNRVKSAFRFLALCARIKKG